MTVHIIKEENALDALEFIKKIETVAGGTLGTKTQVTLSLDSLTDIVTLYYEARTKRDQIPVLISVIGRKFKE